MNQVSLNFMRVLLARCEKYHFKTVKGTFSARYYDPLQLEQALLPYKELIHEAGYKTRGIGGIPCRKAGEFLGPIAEFFSARQLPCPNALVVNGKTREPGDRVLLAKGTRHWSQEAIACLYCRFNTDALMKAAEMTLQQ